MKKYNITQGKFAYLTLYMDCKNDYKTWEKWLENVPNMLFSVRLILNGEVIKSKDFLY